MGGASEESIGNEKNGVEKGEAKGVMHVNPNITMKNKILCEPVVSENIVGQ